ncbi:hypothetical protein G6011_05066 [Alternaria panax]|uniref:Uncharacterized protein n=1 Tax=Alternaria panax TaxID=48097 RepID=A0AAD4FC33_9PLEO|nr:hypothetical protein G6011_05066 [Alternaria panax]
MPRVTISGTVDESLVQSTAKDFARDKFKDTNALIKSWTATKAQGIELFRRGNGACLEHWAQVKNDTMEAHKGPMCTLLVEQGGSLFVKRAAELYYTTKLNIVAIGIHWFEQGDREVMTLPSS